MNCFHMALQFNMVDTCKGNDSDKNVVDTSKGSYSEQILSPFSRGTIPGSSCSKLTTSLVNVSLKFKRK